MHRQKGGNYCSSPSGRMLQGSDWPHFAFVTAGRRNRLPGLLA